MRIEASVTRALRRGDAEAVLAMQHAQQRSVLGRTDLTLDDVRDDLANPDIDPDSPVAFDPDGEVLGSAMVFHAGQTDHADVDVVVHPDAGRDLFLGLLDQGLRLAVEGARRRGHPQVEVDHICYRDDTHTRSVLEATGFGPATTFHRMRRELDRPVEARVPASVEIERVDVETEAALRRAYGLHSSTFAGHFGFTARSWDDWLALHLARTGNGPLWFATLAGVDVAFLHESSQFADDENAGYVARLGVEESARGGGVARALLLSAFAGMRERGLQAALLHVDSANQTGATRLYESVGMRPVLVVDVWRRTLPT